MRKFVSNDDNVVNKNDMSSTSTTAQQPRREDMSIIWSRSSRGGGGAMNGVCLSYITLLAALFAILYLLFELQNTDPMARKWEHLSKHKQQQQIQLLQEQGHENPHHHLHDEAFLVPNEAKNIATLYASSSNTAIIDNTNSTSTVVSSRVPPLEWIPYDTPGGPPRPPLNQLIKDLNKGVIGDVQWLLDFAIVGHSKTGTTGQQNWLASHPEIAMYTHELHSLGHGQPAELVKFLYQLPKGGHLKRGYKFPHELQRVNSVRWLQTFWPRTKFIVGLRHPIKWFESYYNFNWRMGNHLPKAQTFVGENFPDGVMFHEHLARLGKTNLSDPNEYHLLGRTEPDFPPFMFNEVFLYEVSQPFDTNTTRLQQYCDDFTNFLGLQIPLKPQYEIQPENETARGDYHYKIDICKDRFKELRGELLEMGRNASKWLMTYFLPRNDVHFSSPENFIRMIQTWETDPCEQEQEQPQA